MRLKLYPLLLTFLFSATSSANSDLASDCKELSGIYRDMQSQLPINVDMGVQLVGAEATYFKSSHLCRSSLSMLVNADVLLDMYERNGKDRDAMTKVLQSQQYHDEMKTTIQAWLDKKVEKGHMPSSTKGMLYRENWTYIGIDAAPINVEYQFK